MKSRFKISRCAEVSRINQFFKFGPAANLVCDRLKDKKVFMTFIVKKWVGPKKRGGLSDF